MGSSQKRSTQLESDTSTQLAKKCAFWAHEKKAENVLVLDVSQLTSFADNFIVCSASGERQAQAVARHVMDSVKEDGAHVFGVEGLVEGNWILIDLGDVVFHVFTAHARDYYDLDGLWGDAPIVASLNSDDRLSENAFMSVS